MKCYSIHRTLIRVIPVLLLPLNSFAQTFFGVASSPADGGTQGTNTATVTPPSLMTAGDLVIIYAHYRANTATFTMQATGGQSWTQETTDGGSSQAFTVFWCRFNGTWAGNPAVRGPGTNGLSAIMYVYRPTNSNNLWDIDVAAINGSQTSNINTDISAGGLTTTAPNTVTMAFWATPASSTWGTLNGTGWSKTGLSAQYRNISGSAQSHTAAYNIRTTAGAVAPVSQRRLAGGANITTQTSIITWYELPPPPPPSNDDCAGAISLPVNSTCAKTMGSLVGATNSGLSIPSPCSGTVGPDVWYRFVATSATTNINIADFGANFGATRRIQLFTGTCAGLTSVACATGTGSSVSMTSPTLTPGNTYYVRVLSDASTSPNSNTDFSICVVNPLPPVRLGNSYVNITRQTTGGVVQPGDILEIRTTINVTSGTIYRIRYVDDVPSKTTMLTGASDRLRVLSNEGIQLAAYTLAGGDDGGTYKATPTGTEYQIRMNLNFNGTTTPPTASAPANNTATESTSATGQLTAGNVPNVFGSTLFATAFRVQVTGAVGDIIELKTGKFIYRTSTSGLDIELTTTPYQILISSPMSLCANSTGVNMSEEFGGTFGTGTTLNRGTDLASPIPGYAYVEISANQALGDGQYAIVKNMSPRSGVNRNAERSPVNTTPLPSQNSSAYRMHGGHWDIDGDHTGTNDAIGNIPTPDGVSAGYMLMVNADYVASETYRQTLTNLCPNTYYEFSAWFRNICPTCGNDYATGNNYSPRKPGVPPNLTFTLDGLDRYSTGEIPYYSSGTIAAGWVKKGFVFITGPTQTTATLSIRNNSQGGGGNDWAMDDITVATCLPDMTYTPTLNPTVCMTNTITINNTVRSYFSNYNHYKWQRSTDGGSTWLDIPGETGSATPTPVSGQWEFPTSYVVPPAYSTLANNGDRYRLIVATTAANLNSPTCLVTDGVSQVNLNVIDCGTPLKTDLLSFNGRLSDNHSVLSWTTSREEKPVRFFIEKSTDGIHFTRIGTVDGYNNPAAENNTYSFTDPGVVTGKTLYRIAVSSNAVIIKYSRTIQLGTPVESFKTEIKTNPFNKDLYFDVTIDKDAKIEVRLLNATGNVVKQKSYTGYAGINSFSLQNTGSLAPGVYILQVQHKEKMVTHKVIRN